MNILDVTLSFKTNPLGYKHFFKVEARHSATNLKNQTLKLVGSVDIKGLQNLTEWYRSWTFTEWYHNCTLKAPSPVNAVVSNQMINRLHPKSMSFSPSQKSSTKWIAHLIVAFAKITRVEDRCIRVADVFVSPSLDESISSVSHLVDHLDYGSESGNCQAKCTKCNNLLEFYLGDYEKSQKLKVINPGLYVLNTSEAYKKVIIDPCSIK